MGTERGGGAGALTQGRVSSCTAEMGMRERGMTEQERGADALVPAREEAARRERLADRDALLLAAPDLHLASHVLDAAFVGAVLGERAAGWLVACTGGRGV